MVFTQNIYMKIVQTAPPTGPGEEEDKAGKAVITFESSEQVTPDPDTPENQTNWGGWVKCGSNSNTVEEFWLGGSGNPDVQPVHPNRYAAVELSLEDRGSFQPPPGRTFPNIAGIYVARAAFTGSSNHDWRWSPGDPTGFTNYDDTFSVRPNCYITREHPEPGLIISDSNTTHDDDREYTLKLWVKCPLDGENGDDAVWIVDPELVIKKRSTASSSSAAAGE